jgi:hypothetical protein
VRKGGLSHHLIHRALWVLYPEPIPYHIYPLPLNLFLFFGISPNNHVTPKWMAL